MGNGASTICIFPVNFPKLPNGFDIPISRFQKELKEKKIAEIS